MRGTGAASILAPIERNHAVSANEAPEPVSNTATWLWSAARRWFRDGRTDTCMARGVDVVGVIANTATVGIVLASCDVVCVCGALLAGAGVSAVVCARAVSALAAGVCVPVLCGCGAVLAGAGVSAM